MNTMEKCIERNIQEIEQKPTSHGAGLKQVIIGNDDTESKITQVAKSRLKAGEEVEEHAHPTMDEHFMVLDGNGTIVVEGKSLAMSHGVYIVVPAGFSHKITACEDLELITIGVARD